MQSGMERYYGMHVCDSLVSASNWSDRFGHIVNCHPSSAAKVDYLDRLNRIAEILMDLDSMN